METTTARKCRYCAETFAAKSPRATVCYAQACQRQKNADRGRAWQADYQARNGVSHAAKHYAPKRRAYAKRRRALLRGVSESEHFLSEEIYERDSWKCSLCSGSIDPRLVFPHRGSASIDHTVPINHGGAHTRANVTAAHLGCNAAKRDRV